MIHGPTEQKTPGKDRWRLPLPCIGLSWSLTIRHLLDLCVEKSAEPGDMPLDEEDGEDYPWEPSLKEKLQQIAKSPEHLRTHFPKNRYCEICQRSKK